MPEFTVSWEIQVDAESHEEAARKAKEMRADPETTADVYVVLSHDTGAQKVLDLSVLDGRLPECDRADGA